MAKVVSVNVSPTHSMIKPKADFIELIENHGVKGDAHAGTTVMHVYDRKKNPEAPNLRQFHIIHQELLDEMKDRGLDVKPGEMGENMTCQGIDILGLSQDTLLHIGESAIVKVRGLRKPCSQLDGIQKGLMKATIGKTDEGKADFRTGIMCTVEKSGIIRAGDDIEIESHNSTHIPLKPV